MKQAEKHKLYTALMKQTEKHKLDRYLAELEIVLNPKLLEGFTRQLYACYEENKREAYEKAKISDTALEIEQMLEEFKERMTRFSSEGAIEPRIRSMLMKGLYKDLLKLVMEKADDFITLNTTT